MAVETGVVLLQLFVVLVAAKLAGEVAERLRQPAVLGELRAGVALGPSVLGFMDLSAGGGAVPILTFLAQLGVLLLLFEVGLGSRLKEMLHVGASSLAVAAIGIVGSFATGFAASWVLGKVGFWSDHILFHVFVGATFTATSVGITARVFSDLGRLATAEARIVLGAAVLDDVGGLLVLAVVVALAAGSLAPGAIALKAFMAFGFLAVALLVGTRLLPWTMDRLARARVRGVTLTAGLAFALLMAYLAELAGLAGIVGAFAAGLILATTRQRDVLAERVHHVADLFVPIFFVYVGLHLDLRGAGADAGRIVLATVLLTVVAVVGKLASGLGVLDRRVDKYAVGVAMVPRGEVGLIFALYGLQTVVDGRPLLQAWEYASILLVVFLTTFATPLWLKHALGRLKPHDAPTVTYER